MVPTMVQRAIVPAHSARRQKAGASRTRDVVDWLRLQLLSTAPLVTSAQLAPRGRQMGRVYAGDGEWDHQPQLEHKGTAVVQGATASLGASQKEGSSP